MSRMSRKVSSILLAAVMTASVFTIGTGVTAQDIPLDTLMPISTESSGISETPPEIVPFYVNIRTPISVLNVNGTTGTALARIGSAKATTIHTTMRLQVYSNSKWSTVKTWKKTIQNATTSTLSQKYTLKKGSKYRVYSTFTVGSESATAYSKTVTVS